MRRRVEASIVDASRFSPVCDVLCKLRLVIMNRAPSLCPVVISTSVASLVGLLILAVCTSSYRTAPETTAATLEEQIAAVIEGRSTAIHCSTFSLTDEQVRQLLSLPELQILQLDRGRVTDASFVNLPPPTALRHLRLRLSPLGDVAMRKLAEYPELRVLNIPQGQFSDSGLQAVARLPKLELLRFASPRVTDEGLKALRQATRLRFLHIVSAPITDEGLKHLQFMANLESLYLDDTLVTDEGLSALVRARRDLHIHWRQSHLDMDPRGRDHTH